MLTAQSGNQCILMPYTLQQTKIEKGEHLLSATYEILINLEMQLCSKNTE